MKKRMFAFSVVSALTISASVSGATIFVKQGGAGLMDGSSWTNAFADPQDAINAAGGSDVVWVAAGTYKPTLEFVSGQAQSKSFRIGQAKKVYGGFAGTETALAQRNPIINQTVLSGDIDNDNTLDADNAWHVVRVHWTSGGPITPTFTQVDGFVITMGYADGGGLEDFGGGVYIYEASPAIQNCVVIKNHATDGGGGIYIDGPTVWSDPPMEFPEQQLANPSIRACRVLGNDSDVDGGGVYIVNAQGSFVCCELSGNLADDDGGGVYIATHPNAFEVASEGVFTNCTFANNTGNGRSAYNGHLLGVHNTIMWDTGSTAGHIVSNAGATTPSISASDIEGDSSTLDSNPLLQDELGGDATAGTLDDNLRINPTSPCRNAGTNGSVPQDAYDVDDDGSTIGGGGEPTPDRDRLDRIRNTTVDIGAYESHAPVTCCADITGDAKVNVMDLVAVITGWDGAGPSDVAPECGGDGVVNVTDLLFIITHWEQSPCGSNEDAYDAGSITSVDDCMDLASESYTAFTPEWNAMVEQCINALCKAHIIPCD